MAVSVEAVKNVRQMTGAGIMECKSALEEANGDIEAAVGVLKKKGVVKGMALANKRGTTGLDQGLIECYVHSGGRIASMVEVNCATDFVARTDIFKTLAHDLAMQVAAMDPRFVSQEEVPENFEGTLKEAALLEQPYIRDQAKTVGELIAEAVGKLGENIRVRRFVRYELGG